MLAAIRIRAKLNYCDDQGVGSFFPSQPFHVLIKLSDRMLYFSRGRRDIIIFV